MSVARRRLVLLSVAATGIGLCMWRRWKCSQAKYVLELLKERNTRMQSAESVLAGTVNFPVRPSDIFIVTYPKCGTTWVSQIVHQLRTNGHMKFNEITEVVPWDILALDCGQDLAEDQVAAPRIFKSHEPVGSIAKGARYIYVFRDPRDAFTSFYHFLPSYFALPPNSLTYEQFADGVFAGLSNSGYIWDHFMGWFERRFDPNVLLLFFEDLKDDLPREVFRIAQWMNYDPSIEQDRINIAIKNSSFQFMHDHSNQFDESFTFEKRKAAMGIPADAKMNVGKVRVGAVGTNELSPELRRRLDDRWSSVVTSRTGYHTYEAFRLAVNQERRDELY